MNSHRSKTADWLLLTIGLGVLAGCNVTDEYNNEGTLCIRQAPDSDQVDVQVLVGDCYSSGCSKLASSQCTLARDGSTLVLTSQASVEHGGGPGSCGDDCKRYSSECSLVGLPPGSYTLHHGNFQTAIELPLSGGSWTNGSPRRDCP